MTTATTRSRATKKPADRKPPQKDGVNVTVNGTEFTIPADALDDWELMEDLADLDAGKTAASPRILRRLLGGDYEKAKDLLRDDNGRISVESGAQLLRDIFEALNPNS